MKKIFYLILLITIGVNAQTYAPSTPILNGNVRITTPPTAQPANQPYIMLWGQNAPYNVLGKYLVSDLFTQFGTIPTFQQVLNAGSTANINTPFIVNYKLGTPQAVEFSINDANFQVGVPGANNLLTFDDGFVGFSRPVNGIDATASNQFTTLGQLNSALQSYNLQQVTDNGNITANDIILDALNTGSVSIKGAYDGVPDGSVITFQGDGSVKINTDANGQDLGSSVSIAGVRVSGKKISSSDAIYEAPINDYDFAQKKYVDDAIAGATGNQTWEQTLNSNSTTNTSPVVANNVNQYFGSPNAAKYGQIRFEDDYLVIQGVGSGDNNGDSVYLLGGVTTQSLKTQTPPANDNSVRVPNTQWVRQNFAPVGSSTPTNLSYTASGTNGVVNNSNGTGYTIPAADGTNAGLLLPGDKNKLNATSGTNTGDNSTNTTSNTYADGKVQNALTPASTTKAPSVDAVNTALALKQAVISGTGYAYWNGTTITWVTGSSNTLTQGNGNIVQKSQVVFNDASLPSVLSTPGLLTAGMSVLNITSTLYGNWIAMTSTSSKTANYTLTNMDYKVKLTSGTATFTLPTAVGIAGKEYVLKNSGTGVLTVATTSGQTIDGMASYPAINVQYKGIRVQSDGANWDIIGQF